MPKTIVLAAVAALALGCSSARADVCDYRPSALVGAGTAGAVGTAGAGVAATGAAVNAAGFYTLTHAVTGATMLGSTAGGVSAAGTVGIMGGTAGAVGTVAAFIMAPATIVVGGVVAAGVGAFEGVCYFEDERVTDYASVLAIVAGLSAAADPSYFRLDLSSDGSTPARISIKNAKGSMDEYAVSDLYVVNGVLMHRDWAINTTIGNISFMPTGD